MATKPAPAPVATTSRLASVAPIGNARNVPVDLPERANLPSAEPLLSRPAAYEARAAERNALQSQTIKLEAALADALAARDRAIARKSVDGSDAARSASDAAVGAVVRIEAELAGVRSALSRLEAQHVANSEAAARNKDIARIKAAAQTAQDMLTLATAADAALAAFLAAHGALGEKLAGLHPLVPPHLQDAVFGGGHALTQALLATAAKNQLALGGVVPKSAFPNPLAASLSVAVAHFTKPLIDEAANLHAAPIDWD